MSRTRIQVGGSPHRAPQDHDHEHSRSRLSSGSRTLRLLTIAGVCGLSALSAYAQPTSVSEDNTISSTNSRNITTAYQPSRKPVQQITLDIKDSTIAYALWSLARQADVRLSFDQTQPIYAKRITVRVKETDVLRAFAQVLKGTGLVATLMPDRETIIVRADTTNTKPRTTTGTITGLVIDSTSRSPIEGATVTVIGTKLSAVTQQNGSFRLTNIPIGEQRILVKLFGYKSVERTIAVPENEQTTMRVVLTSIPTTLSGVVTTATGMQRRMEISTDVTQLNVDSIMAIAPIQTLTDLLETRVPGLQVTRTSGTPGDPSRLRLRGMSSINASNAPIVIVDGVRVYAPDGNENIATASLAHTPGEPGSSTYAAPSPLDQIDPHTIETIEVFKGPSASSLYGSDAANGVIVITTKRGRPGKVRMNVSANLGTSSIPGQYPDNTFTFGRFFNTDSQMCRFDEGCEVDSLVTFQAMNDARYRPIGRASTSGASASVSGGTNTITYALTASTTIEQGVAKLPGFVTELYQTTMRSQPPSWMRRPDQHRRMSISNAITIDMTPTFQVVITNALSSSAQQRSSLGTQAAGELLNQYVSPDLIGMAGAPAILGRFHERVKADLLQSQNTLLAQWRVRPTIPVKITAGLNPSSESGMTFVPAGLPRVLVGISDTTGEYSSGQKTSRMASLGANATVPIQLTNGITLPVAIGTDWRQQRVSSQSITTTDLGKGILEPTNFLNGKTTASRSLVASATYGWFLEPRVSVGSRFFVQTGMRLDGGSASGSRVGSTAYPKLGISWIAVDPATAEASTAGWARWLSQLRLRGSLGRAGVEPGPTQNLRLWGQQSVTVDGGRTLTEVWYPRTMGNTKLRPERATEFEGGADIGLLANRISLGATAYRKLQRDAIMDINVAPSVTGGYGTTQSVNIGDILNTGLELTANAQVLDTRVIRWDVSTILSHRRNRLTQIADGMATSDQTGQRRLAVGYPVYGFWAVPLAGFADQNGDGILQRSEIALADSSEYLGTSDPKYSATFTTTVGLFNGRVNLSAAVDYQNAVTQYNQKGQFALESAAASTDRTLMDQAVTIISRGPMTGEEGRSNANTPYYLIQTFNILRLQSLSVSLALPATMTRLLRTTHGTIALQGSNLALKTTYRGIDPNVNAYANGNLSADTGQLPRPRVWVMRVNLYR